MKEKMEFIHLHTHSHYSLLDGLSKLEDLVDLAKGFKMPAMAITDHGNMYGAIEFYKLAKKKSNKNPICQKYLDIPAQARRLCVNRPSSLSAIILRLDIPTRQLFRQHIFEVFLYPFSVYNNILPGSQA